MTPGAQPGNQPGKAKALALGFIGFMGLALGPLGVLVAALAVGVENTWTKGRPERTRASERGGSWLDSQEAWLANDHQQRQARQQARTDWLASGADPATRPATPPKGRRLGDSLHRAVANIALAGRDFKDGFTGGWHAADTARRNGAGLGDTFRARRGDPDEPTEPANDGWLTPDPDEPTGDVVHGPDQFTAEVLEGTDKRDRPFSWACRSCPGRGFDYPTQQAAAAAAKAHACTGRPTPVSDPQPERATRCAHCGEVADVTADGWCRPCIDGNRHITCPYCGWLMFGFNGREFYHAPGNPCQRRVPTDPDGNVLTPNQTSTEGGPVPQAAESNATVLAAKLTSIDGTVTTMTDDVDALNVVVTKLKQQIVTAADLANSAGMPTEAVQAVDAIQQAAALVGSHLDDFSTATIAASEQLTAAADGLTAVRQAEDTLHAAGADGRALDTAAV